MQLLLLNCYYIVQVFTILWVGLYSLASRISWTTALQQMKLVKWLFHQFHLLQGSCPGYSKGRFTRWSGVVPGYILDFRNDLCKPASISIRWVLTRRMQRRQTLLSTTYATSIIRRRGASPTRRISAVMVSRSFESSCGQADSARSWFYQEGEKSE